MKPIRRRLNSAAADKPRRGGRGRTCRVLRHEAGKRGKRVTVKSRSAAPPFSRTLMIL